jgi:threonine/homoserine/homoserine lactone efflux protein
MSFLPSPEILLAFTAASLLLILTPGPDMTLMVGQTLQSGRARGFAALAGATTGLLVHSLLVAFGLSALLVASATAFTIVKVLGVGYLLWLAFQALRHGTALSVSHRKRKPQPLGQVYLMGLTINLLNPKVVMFFLTFLPQFVSASDPDAVYKLLFLGLFFIVLGAPTGAILVLLADRFTAALQSSPRAMRVFDWLFAGLMGAFAVRLLVARAS